MQHALSSHWGPIYGKKHCDLNAANTILRIYGKRHTELIKGFAECVLPKKDNYIQLIKKVKDSACGPDGLPYSAYSVDLELSGQVLENTSTSFAEESDEKLPDLTLFNQQLVWFAPKGEVGEDSVAVLRTPKNLRNVFGSNADSKLISGGIS